ncbi:MAG TPA: hypothetical protein VE078_01585, partial [Thermoanaerobaculia bacterium]|nr:hypothetical protein [Thermoanaerobaculia bacterium]
DPIVVRGRWAYDGGHDGYNEIHAVRTVQKTLPPPDAAGFVAFHDAWCAELSKVPPSPPPDRDSGATPPPKVPPPPPVAPPPTMTPSQQHTWKAQQRDENRWVYHPAIDGCLPESAPPPPPLH